MFAAILVLAFLGPIVKAVDSCVVSFAAFALPHKVAVGIFYANFINLIYLGSSPAAAPYVISSKASTGIYFGYFLLVLPLLAYLNSEVLAEVEKSEDKAETNAISTNDVYTITKNIATAIARGTVSTTSAATIILSQRSQLLIRATIFFLCSSLVTAPPIQPQHGSR